MKMPLDETETGVEVVDCIKSMNMNSISSCSSPVMMLKSAPTCSMTDISGVSSESHSFDLEYSDEELSFSSDEDDEDCDQNDDEDDEEDFNHDLAFNDISDKDNTNRIDIHMDKTLENFALDFPSRRTLDLVIDEMPTLQNKTFLTKPKINSSSHLVPSSALTCKPSSRKNPGHVLACPCCRSYVQYVDAGKQHKFPIPPSPQSSSSENNKGYALTSFVDSLWGGTNSNTNDQSDNYNSDIVSEDTSSMVKSLDYTINSCVIEGWLNKKGTGNDLFGTTSWKPRWCSLVMANIPGNPQEVPLLLVSWHFSVNPSNIIILESTIAVTINKNDTTSNNQNDNIHCFDLVSTKDCGDKSSSPPASASRKKLLNGKLARTFSTSLEVRDEWVSKINQVVTFYDKSKRLSSRQNDEKLLPPTSPIRKTRSSRLGRNHLDLSGLSIAC